ncbi:MAG: Crp/Fnr family transcriptional regulator, partial [Candidatus Dormibacterales bacterium]
FQGLPQKELGTIARALREVELPAGRTLTSVGDSGVGFSVILAGEVNVRTVSGRTRRMGPGQHFGEMALLDREGRSADLVAETDLRLGVITEWGFKSFLAEHPEVAFRMLTSLSRRVREAEAAEAG